MAIKWMQKIVVDYPNSEEAPEALWHSAFYAIAQNRNTEASAHLIKLHQNYPKSFRWKYAKGWAEYYANN